MVVKSVLLEKVEINIAIEAMIVARRKTENTAPCSEAVGPCARISDFSSATSCAGQFLASATAI